jgi:sortase B
LIIFTGIFSGCTGRGEGSDSSSGSSRSSSSSRGSSSAPARKPQGETVGDATPDYSKEIADALKINNETVGWLWVGGTKIEDVVVCHQEYTKNKYYERRTFEGLTLEEDYERAFEGVFYAGDTAQFGDGSREELGLNTTIYGHAMTDVKTNPRYSVKFGPLHDFRDEELARDMPYLFFSTEKENMAFEIFAVFTVNADQSDIYYNRCIADSASEEDKQKYIDMVNEKILPRSKYDYGVELTTDDKIITLSTCIYTMDNGYVTNYPNTYMRYGIMARLVDPSEKLKDKADFTINEDVVYDPDGKLSAA